MAWSSTSSTVQFPGFLPFIFLILLFILFIYCLSLCLTSRLFSGWFYGRKQCMNECSAARRALYGVASPDNANPFGHAVEADSFRFSQLLFRYKADSPILHLQA